MEQWELIAYYFLVFWMWAEFFFGLYLKRRQYWVIVKKTQVPTELKEVLSHQDFEKSRKYSLECHKFSTKRSIFNFALNMGMLFYQGLPLFWEISNKIIEGLGLEPNEMVQTAVFSILMNVTSFFIRLPLSLYKNFVLEERYGFNKQTLSFFFWDKFKKFIFSQLLLIPVFCVAVYIIRISGGFFFLYVWIFIMSVSLFLCTIYPIYIAPIFDNYKPLPEGVVKEQLQNLANSVGFSGSEIYIVEGSKRSSHSNAFIFGIFNTKRIILFDTLLTDLINEKPTSERDEKVGDVKDEEVEAKVEGNLDEIVEENVEEVQEKGRVKENKLKGFDLNEVLAVVCHELGHWKYNHLVERAVGAQVVILTVMIIFNSVYQYETLYEAFGFKDTKPVVVGFFLAFYFVSAPVTSIISILATLHSRRCEKEADGFALKLGKVEHLKSGLIKLNLENLGFPYCDYLFSYFYNSHPPLLERLEFCGKLE